MKNRFFVYSLRHEVTKYNDFLRLAQIEEIDGGLRRFVFKGKSNSLERFGCLDLQSEKLLFKGIDGGSHFGEMKNAVQFF